MRQNGYWPTLLENTLNSYFTPTTAWPAYSGETRAQLAPVDVLEGDAAYTIRVDLPGIKREDIHISLENGRLTITGERKTETVDKTGRCACNERFTGTVERSFKLGKLVDGDKIQATLTDGVLELTLPKRPEVAPKEIPVN
jgi:HSP20 family protein